MLATRSSHRIRQLLLALLVISSGGYVLKNSIGPDSAAPSLEVFKRYGSSNTAGCRILWLGNSHTFGHDVPGLVQQIAAADPAVPVLYIERLTDAGITLADHLRSGRFQDRWTSHEWDYLILQEQSGRAILEPEAWADSVSRIMTEYVQSTPTRAVLMQNWAYSPALVEHYREHSQRSPEQIQQQISSVSHSLASQYRLRLAPVGDAIVPTYAVSHGLPALVSADGNHLEKPGAILAALVVYRALFPESRVGAAAVTDAPYAGALTTLAESLDENHG